MKRSRHPHFRDITSLSQLLDAAERSRKGPKSSQGKSYMMDFMSCVEENCLGLRYELLHKTYHPQPYHTFTIKDPKTRLICAAQFRDRVVHHSLCDSLMPIFEKYAIEDSYACRKGKGTHRAIDKAQSMIRNSTYSLKLDVLHFFETADHFVLYNLLQRLIRDPDTLHLCWLIICHQPPYSSAHKGLPIGNLSSQHFANLYLTPLDRFIKQSLRVKHYIRYMDDLLLCADHVDDLLFWEQEITQFVEQRLLLKLKDQVRLLVNNKNGVPYLGYRIWGRKKRLDRARRKRVHRRLHHVYKGFVRGKYDEPQLVACLNGLDHWARFAQGHRLIDRWHHRHLLIADDARSYHQ